MDFPWNAGHDALRVLVSYALALPVGWYREREAHSIGVRTFPLVSVASCGYVMLAGAVGHTSIDAHSRVIQGLVAGMGFIGGGAILKSEGSVHGTATAASIWNTGVVGAAVGPPRPRVWGGGGGGAPPPPRRASGTPAWWARPWPPTGC